MEHPFTKKAAFFAAIAVVGTAGPGAAGPLPDITDRAPQATMQQVNQSAKADRLAFPEVSAMVVRTQKANRGFFSVSSLDAAEPAAKVINAVVRSPTLEAPGDVDTDGTLAQAADDTADETDVVIVPVASHDQTAINVAEDGQESAPPAGSAWTYPQELMNMARGQASDLWSYLFGSE